MAKISLDPTFTSVTDVVLVEIAKWRSILGITFDPLDTDPNPTAYIATSFLFHGESSNSYGQAINGKVLKVSGANLDNVVELITGLPVSDHDHAVNAVEFGRYPGIL